MSKQQFSETRVVSRNALIDIIQGLRNFFGFRLRAYEEIINENVQELVQKADEEYDVEWYRVQIDPLTRASAIITVYGEGVKK